MVNMMKKGTKLGHLKMTKSISTQQMKKRWIILQRVTMSRWGFMFLFSIFSFWVRVFHLYSIILVIYHTVVWVFHLFLVILVIYHAVVWAFHLYSVILVMYHAVLWVFRLYSVILIIYDNAVVYFYYYLLLLLLNRTRSTQYSMKMNKLRGQLARANVWNNFVQLLTR